jgi:CRP-like cAMP-binding protein
VIVFIDHLQQVPLFSACSRKDLQLVAKRAEEVRVPTGKALVTEGETGHEFFVILSGTARVSRHGRKIASLGPGAPASYDRRAPAATEERC